MRATAHLAGGKHGRRRCLVQAADAARVDGQTCRERDSGTGGQQLLAVFGGYGFVDQHPMGNYLRDARVLTLYEGTSQIQ